MNQRASGSEKDTVSSRLLHGIRTFAILVVILAEGSGMPSIALASDSGTVCGVVRDGEGKGLAGASVTLTSHAGSSNISHATSGPTGEYRFSGLSEGEYSVSADMAGYAAASGRTVQVMADSNTATVDMVLIRTSAKASNSMLATLILAGSAMGSNRRPASGFLF